MADDYAGFLANDMDFFAEVCRYEQPGIFDGALGNLMPMAVANVLAIPLAFITSEQSNHKVGTPILAYNSFGPGIII